MIRYGDPLTEMHNYILIGLIALGLLSWLAVALFALRRAGQMQTQNEQFADTVRFYETVLFSLYERPIWLWREDRIIADDTCLAFLGLTGPVSHLDDLVSEEDHVGLSVNIVEKIKDILVSGVANAAPIEVSLGPNRPGALVDIQILSNSEPNWPIAVLWIEEMQIQDFGEGASLRGEERAASGLRKMIDALPFPVWQRDASLKLEKVNAAYVDAVEGGSAQNVIRNNIELTEMAGYQSFRRIAQEVFKTGKTIKKTQYSIIKGKRRALDVTNSAIKENSSIVGVAVDVTGQEEAYAELNRVLEAQSETLNRLQSPVAIFGPDKILRFYNNAFLRFSQLPEEWLSKEPNQSELFDGLRDRRRLPDNANYPEWKKSVLDSYSELIEPHEEFWYLSDGTTHRILAQPQPLGGLLIVLEDVSDRLALERSYNTLIAVQKETLDSLHDGVGVFGSDGQLKLFNPAFCTLWGMEQDQLDGEPHLEKILKLAAELNPVTEENWQKLLQELQSITLGREMSAGRLLFPDDKIVDYTLVPLPDGAAMVRLTDMTASIGIQDALEERSEALETADRLKSKFITNMSYELRTPLNSIIGFAEMLQTGIGGSVSKTQNTYLSNILDASDELKNMISDVLDLAVIEAGGMVLNVESFNINEMIDELIMQASPRIKSSGIGVFVQMDDNYGEMQGDRPRILQVLYNLMINAIQFAVKGSDVRLSIAKNREEHEMVSFNFEDEKISLVEDEWEQVMNAFERGTNMGPRGGLGLDLALVRSFVELHQGRVELVGGVGQGLKIICILPLEQL